MSFSHLNGGGHSPVSPRNSAFLPWSDLCADAEGAAQSTNTHHGCTDQEAFQHGARCNVLCMVTVNLLHTYRALPPSFSYPTPKRCLTKPDVGVYNDNYDNERYDYILRREDILQDDGRDEHYKILDLLGTGTFGQVVKCIHLRSGQMVAVKVIKNQKAYFNQAWVEFNMLKMLHEENPAESTRHVVKLFSHFIFRGHLCLVFEMLSITLLTFIESNEYRGFRLNTVQTQVRQLLSALVALEKSEIIHCDVKPENILLVDDNKIDVKLIDLGSSAQSKHIIYHYVQSRFYRSPEVLLGMEHLDYKIDVWSLGCVAGELFLGIPLFPGQHQLNMIGRIALMLGDFPSSFLERCPDATKYFNVARGGLHHVFTLKSSKQYERENNEVLPKWRRFFEHDTLRDIIMRYPSQSDSAPEYDRAFRESFLDLLRGMLNIDPEERWSASEAIAHPFLNVGPLPDGKPWVPPGRRRAKFVPRSGVDSRKQKVYQLENVDDDTGQSAARFVGASSFGGFKSKFGPFPEKPNRSTTLLSTENETHLAPPRTGSWSVFPAAPSNSAGHSEMTGNENLVSSYDRLNMVAADGTKDEQGVGESADPQFAPSGARPPAGYTSTHRRRSSSSDHLPSMGDPNRRQSSFTGENLRVGNSVAPPNQAIPSCVDSLEHRRSERTLPLRPPSPMQTFPVQGASRRRSNDNVGINRPLDANRRAIPRPPTPQSPSRMRATLTGLGTAALSVPDRSQRDH